ncbi:MAG TPA: adenylate/guanylate cyclase domain-containing protein [Hanamia sp.]|nr:adenylate/guanylate cyclase domain-containing protein [Hanamia sp.]
MAKINLKNILSKDNDNRNFVNSLAQQLNATFSIEDTNGRILLSNSEGIFPFQFPVIYENEEMGLVKGTENSSFIAELLTHLLNKESERKKLGSEVLNLYQEINLIFNFSEKLAQTIGAKAISKITLEEASHVIKSESGVVVLWDQEKKRLEVAASFNQLFFVEEKINSELPLLLDIILSGQSEILSDISALQKAGIILPEIKSVIYSALKVKHRIMGAIILASNETDKYTAGSLKLLTTLALQSSSAIESSLLYEKSIREAEEREAAMRRIFDATGKFVPYQFLKSLGHEVITDVKLGDQVEKIVTVLFTDIRNYTSLSEQMTPEETFGFICLFNARMGPIIRKHNGFINQYLGDSIMAIFTANAGDALKAAIEIQKEMQGFNKIRQSKNKPSIQIGVGMHTGPLIMGITGDYDRMDACTISDTVNTASRVESLTKHYKAAILLSDESLKQITDIEDFHLRNLGLVQLKGKLSSINIHECFSCDAENELQKKLDTLTIFNEGVSFYLNKSFRNANSSFKKVIEADPDDPTAKFFYNNTRQIIETGVPESKSGIVEMEEK